MDVESAGGPEDRYAGASGNGSPAGRWKRRCGPTMAATLVEVRRRGPKIQLGSLAGVLAGRKSLEPCPPALTREDTALMPEAGGPVDPGGMRTREGNELKSDVRVRGELSARTSGAFGSALPRRLRYKSKAESRFLSRKESFGRSNEAVVTEGLGNLPIAPAPPA